MEIGGIINGYTVITPIGQGGAGIVYDVQKGSAHYALKECTDIDEESLRRFARELRIAKALMIIQLLSYLLPVSGFSFIVSKWKIKSDKFD